MKRFFLIFISATALALFFGLPHLLKSPRFMSSLHGKKLSKAVAPLKEIKVEEIVAPLKGLNVSTVVGPLQEIKFSEFLKSITPSRLVKSFKTYHESTVRINKYERMTFGLLRKNRELKVKLNQLQSRVDELETQRKFFLSSSRQTRAARFPASAARPVDEKNDLVKLATYKWKDRKLLQIARGAWKRKDYPRSAQYFYTLIKTYPKSRLVDDTVLFQTAMASLQSKIYNPWAEQALTRILEDHPRSRYYRGAKLWMAIVYFERGNKKQFYQTLEEFRLKYRNTPEWRILSKHYGKKAKSDYI